MPNTTDHRAARASRSFTETVAQRRSRIARERAQRADHAAGKSCSNCPGRGDAIEDNGCTGADLTYLCTDCGHQ